MWTHYISSNFRSIKSISCKVLSLILNSAWAITSFSSQLARMSRTSTHSDPPLHPNSSSISAHSSGKLWPGEKDCLLLANEGLFLKSGVCAELVAYENNSLKPGRSARSEWWPLSLSLGLSLPAGVSNRQKPITGDMKEGKIKLCMQNLPWLKQKPREGLAQAWFASSDSRKSLLKGEFSLENAVSRNRETWA